MKSVNMTERLPRQAVAVTALMVALSLAASVTTSDAVRGQTEVVPWKAVAASGDVKNRPVSSEQAVWVAVSRGDRLQPASLVRTGRRGRATFTRDASILIVDPRSQLVLPEERPDEPVSRVLQSSGTVIYEVDRRDDREFEVITPYLVAGVKGTVFGVTVGDQHTMVSVEEGIVEVRSSAGDAMDVHAGEAVLIGAEDATVEVLRRDRARTDEEGRSAETRRQALKKHRHLNEFLAAVDREVGENGDDDHGTARLRGDQESSADLDSGDDLFGNELDDALGILDDDLEEREEKEDLDDEIQTIKNTQGRTGSGGGG